MPSRVIYLLYRAALLVAFPFILAYVAFRCVKNRAYVGTVAERFGFLPASFKQPVPGAIWLHAVSVGEVISAIPLVTRLKADLPGATVFVSVGTLAGRELADQRLADLTAGIFCAPFDFVFVVRRVLRWLRPALVIVMETEIWPNLWREAKRTGAGLLLVNARISDRAMPRYRAWRWFFRPVMQLPDRILAQTEISRERFASLGARLADLTMGGNLKYDFDPTRAPAPGPVVEWAEGGRQGLIWVAASTMPPAEARDPDEDAAVVEMYQRLAREFPGLRLVLAPRRPERFATAAAQLESAGVAFVRRSRLGEEGADSAAPVLLLDSMGELAGIFRLADLVFVGGTLCRRGGHNILEPAFFGKPIAVGPHMENFPEIAAQFQAASAFLQAPDAAALEDALRQLLADGGKRAELGARGQEQARRNSGATALAAKEARLLYENSMPRPFPSILLSALAAIWRLGGRIKRSRGLAAIQTLPRPVISVGGIGLGGAGKTPFAIHLAQSMRAAGHTPAFLTRGYRRISQERCTVIPAGGPAAMEQTGDEAQLMVRSGVGPVGICADRARAGRAVFERFAPDLFVLDDGFQHARLARTVDLVLIDTLDPFGGFAVIPAGRLREPLTALSRATAFVLTRCEPGRTYEGIVRVLRRYNPQAPVFRAGLVAHEWVDVASGQTVASPSGKGAAACGLGNPASFWRTLDRLGLEPEFRIEFPDHHRYHPRDLQRLDERARQAGCSVIWTTEKDAMNLPSDWTALGLSCAILALRVGIELEDEPAFLAWLESRSKLAETRSG